MYEYVGDAGWHSSSVYDLAVWKNGLAFKNIDFSDVGRPVIKIAELKNGVTGQTARTMAEYDPSVFVRTGDMLFSWSGNPDTSIDVFRWDGEDGWLNQHIFKVAPKAGISEEFLFFVLKWLKPRFAEIARNKQTTGLGHVTIQDLKRMMVGVPDLDEQNAIVGIVGPLQNKIELNRRMNETLEAMARAIFRDWFVTFGPTRAKQEGRAPYLAPDIWSLFPDRLDDDGKPEGWSVKPAGEVFDVRIGRTPPRKEQEHFVGGREGVPWLSIKTMGEGNAFLFETEEALTSDAVRNFRVPMVAAGTVLLSFKLTVGRVVIAGVDMATNEAIAHLNWTERFPVSSEYTYLAMKEFDFSKLGSTSSIATAVNSQSIKSIPILLPDSSVLNAFDEFVRGFFQKIRITSLESRTLAATRDFLLPKLMSGEIRVKDAEKIVEEVT